MYASRRSNTDCTRPARLFPRGRLEGGTTEPHLPRVEVTRTTISHPYALHEVYTAAGDPLPFTRKVQPRPAHLHTVRPWPNPPPAPPPERLAPRLPLLQPRPLPPWLCGAGRSAAGGGGRAGEARRSVRFGRWLLPCLPAAILWPGSDCLLYSIARQLAERLLVGPQPSRTVGSPCAQCGT